MTVEEHIQVTEHWQEIVRQQIACQATKVREHLGHEAREIRFCLDNRPDPNINMALGRVRNIERFLDEL